MACPTLADVQHDLLPVCTVVDQDMRRSRTSLRLSYHCLLRVFRERAERGAFSDNTRAREALVDEIARTETPPVAIFVDALEFPLRYYDWAECSKVVELHFPIIVRVASWDVAPKGIPVLPAPAQGATPCANITAILKEGRVPAVAHVHSTRPRARVATSVGRWMTSANVSLRLTSSATPGHRSASGTSPSQTSATRCASWWCFLCWVVCLRSATRTTTWSSGTSRPATRLRFRGPVSLEVREANGGPLSNRLEETKASTLIQPCCPWQPAATR